MSLKPKLSLNEYFSFLESYFAIFKPKIIRMPLTGKLFKL
jgi:hypothetical protein